MSSADSAGNISRHRKLGELTGNIRTFALPFEEQPYTFKMQYTYDSYNRMQSMTYPDGEVVSYGYNRGGMLESVRGDKGGDHRIYVENISYNTHGLKESVFYGNGTHTDYGYDLLMRLSHLYSENGLGEAMQDIDYGYDDADNITDILNSAMTLANGLGGNYWSHYDYDNLYRLEHSEGEWDGGQQLNYSLLMQYSPNGRIERKELYAEVMDHSGTVTVTDYVNIYQYNAGQPNTLDYVADELSGREQRFSWDAAGNMTVHDHFREECHRQLCWDEENRLAGFSDCRNAGFYQYDANGVRTYKLTGGYAAQNIQGHWWSYNLLDNPTLYASPYVVATAQGYTKHYYAESERIASRIGNGGLADIAQTVVNMEDLSGDVWVGEMQPVWDEVDMNEYYVNKQEDIRNHLTDVMMCAGEDPIMEEDLLFELRDYWRYVQEDESVASEPDCYWYHPDHLGSSSWITFSDGSAVQHLHYLPWGEDFVDQRLTSWAALHTFSAKERDSETGLSYFGARYYSSDLSIWLSVDPMSDKYPSLSPYVYCADNPVRLVDPNGEELCDGGKPSSKRRDNYNDFFDKKIRTPLMRMVESGASDDDLEAAAAYLSNKYQKRLLKGYHNITGWDRKDGIDVKVFSETEKIVNVKSRPDNQEMTVCGEIPLGPDVYSAEVNFAPYGIENNATFTALNTVETGWINASDDNSFTYNLEVDGASSISYCIQNRLTDKRQDNWSFSVTLRSRRLDIRSVLRISDYRTRRKHVRTR